MFKRSDFEIMAPVGSRESMFAAIQAKADAVYFGVENLNMRAHSAKTFTIADLKEIASICREHGIKSYLTVNTIIYDEERPLMREILDAAKAAGIDAIIASDVAVMSYCRQVGLEVHPCSYRNVLSWRALHGGKRKMLLEFKYKRLQRQSRQLYSNVSPLLHCQR